MFSNVEYLGQVSYTSAVSADHGQTDIQTAQPECILHLLPIGVQTRKNYDMYSQLLFSFHSSYAWFIFSICSIQLDQLQNPNEAVRIVGATQSVDGAKMVAK